VDAVGCDEKREEQYLEASERRVRRDEQRRGWPRSEDAGPQFLNEGCHDVYGGGGEWFGMTLFVTGGGVVVTDSVTETRFRALAQPLRQRDSVAAKIEEVLCYL
jgi:hypothetical protein